MPNNATVITTSMMPYAPSAGSLAAAAAQAAAAAAAAGAAPSPAPGSVAVGGVEEKVLPGGVSTAAGMLNGVSPVLPTGQVNSVGGTWHYRGGDHTGGHNGTRRCLWCAGVAG